MNKICVSAALAVRRIGYIAEYLDTNSRARLDHAFILSKIDFGDNTKVAYPSDRLQTVEPNLIQINPGVGLNLEDKYMKLDLSELQISLLEVNQLHTLSTGWLISSVTLIGNHIFVKYHWSCLKPLLNIY